ncbi:MAG: hypothetical protein PIR02_15320 [Microbacterium enclense]
MSTTVSPPRRPSPGARRARRERLTTWITMGVVLVVCAIAGFGAYAMANSWWVEEAPAPAADQQLPDGQSRFDRAGTDFFTRQGVAVVGVAAPAAASDLGLPADGDTPVETLVPLTLEVRGTASTLSFPGVSWFAVSTEDDRLTAVTVVPASSTTWTAIRTDLEQRAAAWGWSASDVEDLARKVGEAGRADGVAQTLSLPPTTVDGMTVSADVTVDAEARISLRYVFTS